MILSGKQIEKERENGNIIIKPFNPAQLNPNSYNLRLSNELVVYADERLDMKIRPMTKTIKIPDEGMWLRPGQLYLGRTAEYTETHNFVPMIDGRSSIGRLGLFIHATAGFGDVGFSGYWTLEMMCTQMTKIYPLVQIGQIYYHTIYGEHEEYKNGKYQNNTGIQASKLYEEYL